MSNQPPEYPQQPFPQQPYGQPGFPQQQPYMQGPPPKQSHTVRNVILILIGVMVLTCGGCLALAGVFVNEVDKEVKKSEAKDRLPGGPDNPMEITPGKAFEVQDFYYAAGWSIKKDVLGDIDITDLKVTNLRGEKDSAIVEIKFWRGTEVVADADCTTSPIDVRTTVKVSCLSTDKLPKDYDKITINDTF